MAGSVNKVILIGNLGADPEIRRTQDGRPIANLRVATSETWRDKATGERREKTEWHRVVIFNDNLCRIAEQYLKKGSKVYLEGQLQTRKWTDQQGDQGCEPFMFGSYNAGRGTLLRAQNIARLRILDPVLWLSIRTVAPDVPRWRHEETLTYVEKIQANIGRMDDQGRVVK